MVSTASRFLSASILIALTTACGGGSSAGTGAPPASVAPQTGSVAVLLSDASTEDWSTVGVRVLSIALVPQGGGTNVQLYSAPTPAPVINLAQLDQIADILANATVPVGTYTGAILTLSGNAGDVLLTAAADPEPGFTAPSGATISAGQIQIQHTQGSSATLTVPIDVTFAAPITVSTAQSVAVDLEVDLANPAFLVGENLPGSGAALWAVNFNGPVRHHPVHDLRQVVLRHAYGNVTAVAADNTALTITREFPTLPVTQPETAVLTTQSLQILADATNGTIFYDVDAKTQSVVKNFSTLAGLTGKSVRVAARFQADGTLVATRIWASAQFNSVWLSPEGHVLHVDAVNDIVTVATDAGGAAPLTVDANTQFFFSGGQTGAGTATPIAIGTGLLADRQLVRGFKVHATVVDPLAVPLVAQSIDIETAAYDGRISAPDATGFTYTRNFRTAADDYSYTLDYIAGATANGNDPSGAAISGYAWWNFAYPTLIDTGTAAVGDFIAATDGGVNFGGTVGSVPSRGVSFATWNDPARPDGWSARATVLTPSALPLGSVASGLTNGAFTMRVAGGTAAATVTVGTTAGSATRVYQVDRTAGVLTVDAVDVTTAAGLASVTAGLTATTPVKVAGIPQADGTLKAYVMLYFTGDLPAQ